MKSLRALPRSATSVSAVGSRWRQGSSCSFFYTTPITNTRTAHFNLRDDFIPYKKLIAQVLLDKNPHLRTVINKVANVGEDSEFRTFLYEVLSGPNDMNVEIHENGCSFKFDYSKVYWNSRLEAEHSRLIDMLGPGEVLCDVMAGVGPFAVPAGKKGVFVWANDMNPDSHKAMQVAIKKNKVRFARQRYCSSPSRLIDDQNLLKLFPAGVGIRASILPGRARFHQICGRLRVQGVVRQTGRYRVTKAST